MTQILIGGAVGLTSAIIGALVQYRVSRRYNPSPPRELPGCIFLVTGGLGVVGLVMVVASLVFTGDIGAALFPGIGVFVGFFAGFIIMILLWFLLFDRRS